MKKSFKVLAIAAIASLTFVACNNNQTAEEAVDSTAIEQVAEEEVIAEPVAVADTTPVVEEQAPAAKQPVKKAVMKEKQKAESQPEIKKAVDEQPAAPAANKLQTPNQKASSLKKRN